MGTILNILLSLVFPKRCIFCGDYVKHDIDYCDSCKVKAEKLKFKGAFKLNNIQIAVAFCYKDIIKDGILRFKIHRKTRAVKPFGDYVTRAIKAQNLIDDTYIITFVPMTKKAKEERGFNQSELLAKYIALCLNKEFSRKILIKVKETGIQKSLTSFERYENLKGAFIVKNPELIKGKNILLIDDVCTTGSTINECVRTLKRFGANIIKVAVIAKTTK